MTTDLPQPVSTDPTADGENRRTDPLEMMGLSLVLLAAAACIYVCGWCLSKRSGSKFPRAGGGRSAFIRSWT